MRQNIYHGKVIQAVQKNTGLSQQRIANILGISQKTVSEWSTDTKSIDIKYWPLFFILDKTLTAKDFMGDGWTRAQLLQLFSSENFLMTEGNRFDENS